MAFRPFLYLLYLCLRILFGLEIHKRARANPKFIGKRDPNTGKIFPTKGRDRKYNQNHPEVAKSMKPAPIPIELAIRKFYSATYQLVDIRNTNGLTQDLKQCFPATYKQIQSIAYYMILESESPLFRFEKWSTLHKHTYYKTISSQRSSELISDIS